MTSAWAFTHAWNEEVMIPFWVRHYRTFCDKVVVYVDTDTDDATAILAKAEGAEVRPFHTVGALDDFAFVHFAEQHYIEARGNADWVIWTDADEIVYHARLVERLDELKDQGVTYPMVKGYSMLSHCPPSGMGQIYDEIKAGIEVPAYAKVCIFNPELEVAWTTGKHDARVFGRVVRDDGADPIKLLHYRWLGDEWFRQRNARNYARMNEINRQAHNGFESYPEYVGELSPDWYLGRIELARVVV